MFLFLIVAVIACLKIQFTEGRQLKAMKEHDQFSSVRMGTGLQIHARKAIQKPGSTHEDDFQVSPGKKQIFPPTQSHEFSSSDISQENGFGPTTPGNSPGVGHFLAVQKHNMQPKMQDFTSIAAVKDDFKGPGHSPGVGHSFGNANKEPKA